MQMLLKTQRDKLIANALLTEAHRASVDPDQPEPDHYPVVKFFCPWGAATWLFTELDEGEDILYGLCDLGFGTPELGTVFYSDITGQVGPLGLKIERDRHWKANKPLSEYASEARSQRRIAA